MLELIRVYIRKLKLDNERLGYFAGLHYESCFETGYADFLFEECFKALFPTSDSWIPKPADCDARVFDGEVYFWVARAKPDLIPEIESMLLACFEGFHIRTRSDGTEGGTVIPMGMPKVCWQLERT